MHDATDTHECVFCGKFATEDDAIPTFYDGPEKDATEYCDATQCVCNNCVDMHLDFNEETDDWQLKENRIVPECARPLVSLQE
jgi:hypothetical protein